ncbi:PqqD family peptide modification chaperone [Saccharicrinis sp. FJH2]|uniref:PqqD family peptide modification chaperone n=1 Tax=Saccharicrinis sp. FJH65 TaxID=3344659 RepID=UPI0035F2AC91
MISDSSIPKLANGIELLSEDNQYYLYHIPENKVLLLENLVSVNIIKLCNGENSVSSIVVELNNMYSNVTETEIKSDLIEMLNTLNNENFVEIT